MEDCVLVLRDGEEEWRIPALKHVHSEYHVTKEGIMERATLDYVVDWKSREKLIAETVGVRAAHPIYPWLYATGYSVFDRVTLLTSDMVTVRIIYQGVEVV